MLKFDIEIVKGVWLLRRRERGLVVITLVSTASLIALTAIGGDLVAKVALRAVTAVLWVVTVIVYVRACASEVEGSYRSALSLVGVSLRSDDKYMQIVLELRNVLDRPIEYKVDVDKCYTEIDGNRQQQTDRGMSATAVVGKEPGFYQLPRFLLPKSFPCNAVVHYEILCGPPPKSVLRQIRELNLNIDYNIRASQYEIRDWATVPASP